MRGGGFYLTNARTTERNHQVSDGQREI